MSIVVLALAVLFWWIRSSRIHESAARSSATPSAQPTNVSPSSAGSDSGSTLVYAHNLMLRKGPNFRVYVRWLRGQMTHARRGEVPSFDDPDSFFLDIRTGVLRANIGDIAIYLNSTNLTREMKNITLSGDGDQMKLKGTIHKVVPIPIELTATISATPDNRIRLHVTKITALKIPVKGLLGGFNLTLANVFKSESIAGLQVSGNDIFLDTSLLLPPPHIRGQLTAVRIVNPDLEEVFGNAEKDVEKVEEWRNFLRLAGGSLDFGKLTMHHVDLVMIDISNDAWFDIDLANYQNQLVNGYTRMTPQAGMQIFMPDLSRLPKNTNTNVSIEWLKNRNLPPPLDVTSKTKQSAQ
ncbi:MAG: hypothetical protein JO061_00595 [Acidobacteriaceae bacterium]|nr:hypothetical protein [Acidobacteriaceae bacterium]